MRDSGLKQIADKVRSYRCFYWRGCDSDNKPSRLQAAPTGVSSTVGALRKRDAGSKQIADKVRSYRCFY